MFKTKMQIVSVVFMLVIGVMGGLTSSPGVSAYTNDCDGWSRELGIYKRVKSSPTMHLMGCTDKPNINAMYNAATGRCNYRARYGARHGLRGSKLVSYVKAHYCGFRADGTYYELAHS